MPSTLTVCRQPVHWSETAIRGNHGRAISETSCCDPQRPRSPRRCPRSRLPGRVEGAHIRGVFRPVDGTGTYQDQPRSTSAPARIDPGLLGKSDSLGAVQCKNLTRAKRCGGPRWAGLGATCAPWCPPNAGFGRLHRELRASATSIGSWTSEIRNFTTLRLVRRNRCAGDLVSLARPKQA